MKIKYLLQFISIFLFLNLSILPARTEPSGIDGTLERCALSYSNVKDYTCTLHKKELLPDGTYKEQQNILLKVRKPGSYYMKWNEAGSGDFEALYVEGRYDNKLMVHGGLVLKFFALGIDPRGSIAMKENRHAIMEADIGRILTIFKDNCLNARTDKDAVITLVKEEILDARKTWLYKATFPADRGYYGHVIYINLDQGLYLPVKITVYGWKMQLLEMYHFADLKLNAGLTDADFDKQNPAYGFK
jgi:hypothetical protein